MTLFMALAACYGVVQLAVLGWLGGRSVRIGTLMLCVTVGLYACGAVTLLLQFLYTRSVSAITGQRLFEVVRTASYTVDPVIEEIVKVTPLLLLGLSKRVRRQFGLTDYTLMGAGLGAGFGLLEAILRFSHRAEQAIATPEGWIVPSGLSATFIPGLSTTLSSWVPAPATSDVLFVTPEPQTFLHLAWSALAGLGIGVFLRTRGPQRLLGLLPLALVAAEHAAFNYDVNPLARNAFLEVLTSPLMAANDLLWFHPVLALALAAVFDRRDIARGRAEMPDVLLPHDRMGVLSFAAVSPLWTLPIAARFVRARRSLFFAQDDEELHGGVRGVREMVSRAGRTEAWRGIRPTFDIEKLVRDWRLWVWLALALPSLFYFVIGGFPATAGLQRTLETSGASGILLPVLLSAGMVWLGWRMSAALRAGAPVLPGEGFARLRLRLLAGAGGLMVGAFSLLQIFLGTQLSRPPVRNLHVLDALGSALLIVAVLLALALLFAAFPPGGGLVLAGFGATGGAAITVTGEMVLGTALLGTLGIVLMNASSSDGGGSAGPSGPERDGIRLDSTGKVHGNLPDHVPSHWTRAELRELADDLTQSIRTRTLEQLRLGEHGPHRARIAQEERLLRQIERILSGT